MLSAGAIHTLHTHYTHHTHHAHTHIHTHTPMYTLVARSCLLPDQENHSPAVCDVVGHKLVVRVVVPVATAASSNKRRASCGKGGSQLAHETHRR